MDDDADMEEDWARGDPRALSASLSVSTDSPTENDDGAFRLALSESWWKPACRPPEPDPDAEAEEPWW